MTFVVKCFEEGLYIIDNEMQMAGTNWMPKGDQLWKKVGGRTHPIEKSRDRKDSPDLLYLYCRKHATESKKEGLGRKQSLQYQKMGLEDLTAAQQFACFLLPISFHSTTSSW